jgi:uncharacterized protein YozE (UPF0346 family)
MTTSEIISKIFDGTCMLFLGSGFSFGATNSNPKNSQFKGAGTLANMLLDDAGYPSRTNDLRKASSAYLRRKTPEEFICAVGTRTSCPPLGARTSRPPGTF